MNDYELPDLFCALFEGNPHVIGDDKGGCLRVNWEEYHDDYLADHLVGGPPIGVYPICNNKVKWGCVDFDEGEEDSRRYAARLVYYLGLEGITAWPERSRSKGFHVWVFCKEWTEARLVRGALNYACTFIDVPNKEVNPKQWMLAEGQVGNYVRLPYPGALRTDQPRILSGGRRVMVDLETDMDYPFDLFVREAWDQRTDTKALEVLAAWYRPKPEPKRSAYVPSKAEEEVDEIAARLSYSARRLYDNGPKNSDRSSALVALAGRIARDRTHEPNEVRELLGVADRNWGKYSPRADGEYRLDEIVDKAFNEVDISY